MYYSFLVCGTTGKRKACKDCSCGLAEELQAENGERKPSAPATKSATSSCGSVRYLLKLVVAVKYLK